MFISWDSDRFSYFLWFRFKIFFIWVAAFCLQMLVYEFMTNGTLRDHLSGTHYVLNVNIYILVCVASCDNIASFLFLKKAWLSMVSQCWPKKRICYLTMWLIFRKLGCKLSRLGFCPTLNPPNGNLEIKKAQPGPTLSRPMRPIRHRVMGQRSRLWPAVVINKK